MSKVGKKPIAIPKGVEVSIVDQGGVLVVKAKGPKGSLEKKFSKEIKIENKDNQLILTRINETKPVKSLHGCYRALVNNMVIGVSTGFSKQLTWEGVGYRMQPEGKGLNIQMGFSHDVKFPAVAGIEFKVDNNNLTISGMEKDVVGQVAANIREIKGPEPYKGKGIRYIDEHIQRKAGKAAK